MTGPPERLSSALAGRYRLERELGQGGMATVYLAEDLRHHRQVALKVMRPELAATLGAERFLREIETTAQLTHPHILPIHDSGVADGALFYVMPYVEGESLRDRLVREEQLPLDDALRIAREVADALSFAHGHGVIHRDIKPENILLEAGHAVVSDFGIARAVSAAGGAKLTETGLAVGTPAYMSPEQAAGSQSVDGRSDVYSLGCVLYEMLSGETPYTGPTPQAIFAKKLSEPLPRISVVREAVPPGVEAALNKSLARTPADRWPSAADFADALAHPETVITGGGGTWPTRVPPVVAARTRRRRAAVAVGAGVVLLAAAITWQLLPPRPLTVTGAHLTPVTSEPGLEFQPSISPDGKQVAYTAGPISAPRLFVKSTANVSGGAAVRIGGSAPDSFEGLPRWATDGQSVRYQSCPVGPGGCGFRETGSLGGAVRSVTVPRAFDRISWSTDGARVAYFRNDTLFAASATDTVERRIAVRTEGNLFVHSLEWSPDGRLIAYVAGNPNWLGDYNTQKSSIWVVDSRGGVPRQVVSDEYLNVSPAWLDARHLLFVSDRDGPTRGVYVVAVGPNGPRGAPRGIPGIADPHSISYAAGARGLAFSRFILRQSIWSYPLTAAAPMSVREGRPVTTGNEVIEEHDVSPDGRWIAYSSYLLGSGDLYKVPLAGGPAIPLTATRTRDEWGPRWSPDGREIAFYASLPVGGIGVFVMPAEGGAPERVSRGSDSAMTGLQRWQPSGLGLSYWYTFYRGGGGRAFLATRDSLRGAWRGPALLVDSGVGLPPVEWAPDGSGFVSPVGDLHDRRAAVFVLVGKDLSKTRRAWPAASELRFEGDGRYARDGRTFYAVATHRDGRRGVWALPVATGSPRLVVAFDDPALPVRGLSLGPDRLYLTVADYQSDIWVADLKW